MKVKVTNTGKQPVERLGHVFLQDKPQEIEVTERERKALRAVRPLKVEDVAEKPAPTSKRGAGKSDDKGGE